MKQQFVVTHTIRPTEIPALLDNCVYKYSICQNVASTKTFASPYIYVKKTQHA